MVVVKTEIEKVVNEQFPQTTAIPLQNAREQHYEQRVTPNTPALLLLQPELAAQTLQHEEHRSQL